MSLTPLQRLKAAGVQPSAQRLAVASYVLDTVDHPSADQVLAQVQETFPMLSRATVYNTLNLFVEKGLIRELVLSEGRVVFDPCLEPHHHFVDDESGLIEDIPWQAVKVGDVSALKGYEVREFMIVMRGRKLGGPRAGGRLKSSPRSKRRANKSPVTSPKSS
jgi:Fur family transcriptional regulator, iron response regulator